MNQSMFDSVYDGLKQYITIHSNYKPSIYHLPKGDVYPKVIVEEISNVALTINDSHSQIGIEINIYAKEKAIDGELISEYDICREIQGIVDRYMSGVMKFRRIISKSTPNIDNNIYRITMQYIATSSDNRCCFF